MTVSYESGRSSQTIRIIQIAIDLSESPKTIHQLSSKHEVGPKTIRRDIHALEGMGIPVHELIEGEESQEYTNVGRGRFKMFRVDRHWMKYFLPKVVTCPYCRQLINLQK